MRSNFIWTALLSIGSLLVLSGCSGKPAGTPHVGGEHHHVHGPHEGELIEIGKEIGKEEYHAELLTGENNTITIYVLDKEGKQPVPIAAEPIAVSMVVNASPVEFTLDPKPQEGDPAGKSSRFESTKPELGVALGNPDAKRELKLKIGETDYKAPFPHFDEEEHHQTK
jgi:hypothetical protein